MKSLDLSLSFTHLYFFSILTILEMKPVVFWCYSQRTHSELLTVKIVCGI